MSELETELFDCKLRVVEHLITPDDLKNMRQNFLRRKKRRVFNDARLDGYLFDPHAAYPEADTSRRYDFD